MNLFTEFFKKMRKEVTDNVKVRHVGITDNLSSELLY